MNESKNPHQKYERFLESVADCARAKAQNVSNSIRQLGPDPRFFTGDIDGAPASLFYKMHGERIARLILNIEVKDRLLIEDFTFTFLDNRGIRVHTVAQPKTEDQKNVDALLLEIRKYNHEDEGMLCLPGTTWDTSFDRGPILSCDAAEGIVVVNRSITYEKVNSEQLATRRVRNENYFDGTLELLGIIPDALVEIPIQNCYEGSL